MLYVCMRVDIPLQTKYESFRPFSLVSFTIFTSIMKFYLYFISEKEIFFLSNFWKWETNNLQTVQKWKLSFPCVSREHITNAVLNGFILW